MKTELQPAFASFSMKPGMRWQRVDLEDQFELHALLLHRDQPVDDRLPVAVAREVVVGDEEFAHALRDVFTHDRLDIVGRAEARFAALDVDDGAERALERAAAASIEARVFARDPRHDPARQDRQRRIRHFGHVGEVIVDRLQRTGVNVAQKLTHAAFPFACEQRDAHIERLLQIERQAGQHRDAATDMESTHHHRDAGGAELAREIECSRILVRLDADEPDEAAIGGANPGDCAFHIDNGVALVKAVDVDFDIGPEDLVLGAFGEEAVHACEAV